MTEAEQKIKTALRAGGTTMHNIISMILSGVARREGKAAANKLVRDCKLTDKLGIQEQPE